MTRDEQHDWNGCKCSRCLRLRDEQHKWEGSGQCSVCHVKIKIEELTDQSMLLNIAENDYIRDRRVEAAIKLTDKKLTQKLVANEAKKLNLYKDETFFCELLNKITEQEFLVDIVINNKILGYKAFDRVTDHKSLVDIAINAKCDSTCISVLERLIDQNDFLNIAQNAKHYNVRFIAASKLIEKTLAQSIYIKIAKNTKDYRVRLEAAEKLDDHIFAQEIYAEVAKNAEDWRTRSLAAKKLTDKSLAEKVLAECAVEEKEEESNGLTDEYRRYLYNN